MSDPNFFLSRLNGEPHALAFGGQSTPWPVALADLTNDPALEATLRGHVAAANTMLAPVAADLLATTGRAVDLFGFKPNPARLRAAARGDRQRRRHRAHPARRADRRRWSRP